MDLKLVIAELRAELESIDQVLAALEKLAALRSRRTTLEPEVEEAPQAKSRSKKTSPARESAASAGTDG